MLWLTCIEAAAICCTSRDVVTELVPICTDTTCNSSEAAASACALAMIAAARSRSRSWTTSRSKACDTSWLTIRRLSRRFFDGSRVSDAKKSMVPTTRPSTWIGKQMPLLTPDALGDGGADAVGHLADVGHEHEIARPPGSPRQTDALGERRRSSDPPELLAGVADLDLEAERVRRRVDLPVRAVGPAEPGAHRVDRQHVRPPRRIASVRRGRHRLLHGAGVLGVGLGGVHPAEFVGHVLPVHDEADVAAVHVQRVGEPLQGVAAEGERHGSGEPADVAQDRLDAGRVAVEAVDRAAEQLVDADAERVDRVGARARAACAARGRSRRRG